MDSTGTLMGEHTPPDGLKELVSGGIRNVDTYQALC